MEKVFVKLKDSGSSFHIPGVKTFVGKKVEEVEATTAILNAIRVGALVKLTEAEYKEATLLADKELAEIKAVEVKAIELGNPNNLDAARLALAEANPSKDGNAGGAKVDADLNFKELVEVLKNEFPDVAIPAKVKKDELLVLLTDARAAKAKEESDNENN